MVVLTYPASLSRFVTSRPLKVVLVLQIEIIRPGMRLPSQSVTGRADIPVQMLQIEMFDDRDRCPAPVWWLLCGGFPVCHRYANWRKSLLYSFPLSPSSSGQGRHPFKVDIAGSNPAGGTTESEKPVTNSVVGFLLPIRRDSNPTGCGAEETRSVFQRSTQGAERRSGSGRRQPHADIPLGAPIKMKSPLLKR